jgi:DNA helicase-2/ATP-dependent DNA helicase PcrA
MTPPRQVPTSPTLSTGVLHLVVGDKVSHERFGQGTVISLDGAENSAKAVVDFQGVGRKTLLLSFAKLQKIIS